MNQVAIDSIAPPRLDLARTPTPLELLAHTSLEMGVDIYVKRDDYTGMELSGNKIRKLEFIMADALASDADTIITCGGAQSNHARATAIAAAKLGLDCRLILRTADPAAPPAPDGQYPAELHGRGPDRLDHAGGIPAPGRHLPTRRNTPAPAGPQSVQYPGRGLQRPGRLGLHPGHGGTGPGHRPASQKD
jgi:hypothetical protein